MPIANLKFLPAVSVISILQISCQRRYDRVSNNVNSENILYSGVGLHLVELIMPEINRSSIRITGHYGLVVLDTSTGVGVS